MAERAARAGVGRMAEPLGNRRGDRKALGQSRAPPRKNKPLSGKHIVITAGPNARADRPRPLYRETALPASRALRSHVRQQRSAPGVTLISGPVHAAGPARREDRPRGRRRASMLLAVQSALACRPPAFFAAAGRGTGAPRNDAVQKLKKRLERPAEARAGREPRYPGDGLEAQDEAPATRHRLLRRRPKR